MSVKRDISEVSPRSTPEQENKQRLLDLFSPPPVMADTSNNGEAGSDKTPSWFAAFEERQNKKIDNLTADMSEVKTSMNKLLDDVKLGIRAKELAESNSRDIEDLQTKMDQINACNESLKSEVSRLKRDLLKQEVYNRRDNLNFEGIPEQVGENCGTLVRDILEQMKVPNAKNIAFTRCHRFGPPNKKPC